MNENETKRERLCAIMIAFAASRRRTAERRESQGERKMSEKLSKEKPRDRDVMEYFHQPKNIRSGGGSSGKEWKMSEHEERRKLM